MPLPDRGNGQSKHRYLNIVNRKVDNQLPKFKSALGSFSLVNKRGLLPRPCGSTMLGIDTRDSGLHRKYTSHLVGRSSCPATRQKVIGQTPKKALTYTPILQYVNRRGRSLTIVVPPGAQATTPSLISKLIIRHNKIPRDKRWFVPTGQRLRIHRSGGVRRHTEPEAIHRLFPQDTQ